VQHNKSNWSAISTLQEAQWPIFLQSHQQLVSNQHTPGSYTGVNSWSKFEALREEGKKKVKL
jgi:hypothetical protein